MAVYTEVSDEALAEFLTAYDVGELSSLKGIAEGVENSNYLIGTDRQGRHSQFILTLYEKRVDPADLPFFLGLMDHLAERGLPCPVPVKDKTGAALQTLCGKPAAMVSFLDGVSVRRPQADHCYGLGAAMADMHRAGMDFPMRRPNSLSLAGWQSLAAETEPRADEVETGLSALVHAEIEALSAHWPADLPAGVIHADLFPDNVFFRGTALTGLIDFYFACTDQLAYDLAIALNAWCFEPDLSFNVTKANHLIEGYRSHRDLSAAEIEALPLLARGAALRFLLTRLHDWFETPDGALVQKKDPMEYVKKLRFHQGVASAGAYGITR